MSMKLYKVGPLVVINEVIYNPNKVELQPQLPIYKAIYQGYNSGSIYN